jgi:gamma-glutamyltranspeptidase/glutathione hydrolase
VLPRSVAATAAAGAPVEAAVDPLAAPVEAAVDPIAAPIEASIDACPASVEARVHAVTAPVETGGPRLEASLGGALGAPVEAGIDAIAAPVEPFLDPLAAPVEAGIDAIAASVEPFLDPIAALVQPARVGCAVLRSHRCRRNCEQQRGSQKDGCVTGHVVLLFSRPFAARFTGVQPGPARKVARNFTELASGEPRGYGPAMTSIRPNAGRGIVAAGHPATCAAAATVLAAGGNAFDAVVAAGFAAAAAEPTLTGLGGGGFLLAHGADGAVTLYDFFVDTPGLGLPGGVREPHFLPVTVHFGSAEQDFNVGLASVAVPGCLAGYLHVHERLGRLALGTVIAPAVRLAREGVPLNAQQAYLVRILQPILTLGDAGRELYTRRGRPVSEGERIFNPKLAEFLERLAGAPVGSGPRDFAAADLASAIAADMAAGGGHLTAADLSAYRVVDREPLELLYRDHRLLTNPAPSFGGSLLAVSLTLLEEAGTTPPWGTAEHLIRLTEVMQETDAIRERGEISQRLRATGGTTHVSVSDAAGNVAAMTTSNGEGSGYLAPGTGVMLNNMMGEEDLHPEGFHASRPGLRVASMMCPSLLMRDGVVSLALGSGGSKRIRTALAQVLSNVVDHGMDPRAAIEAPRLHWDGECLQVEPGYPEAALRALGERWPLNPWDERNLYFGGVHAVAPGIQGVGDPRRGGSVARC